MATVNAERNTLLDVVSRTGPDGQILPFVEMLQKRSALLKEAHWVEANTALGHKFTHRNALPTVEWRKYNQGVTPSKSRGAPITETAGMMEGRSEVDRDLAKLNGNEAAFRMSEDKGFIQSMTHEAETGAFYHSTATAPEKFQGLAPRYNSTTATGGGQIIEVDASPSGSDQTSIWLVGWGEDTVSMFYPKGMPAGIETIDMGLQDVDDGTGKMFLDYVTVFKWHIGMYVKDWRYVVRLANIDTSAAAATDDTIIPAMIDASYRINSTEDVRPVFYMNRTVFALLHKQARNATKNATLSTTNIGGSPLTSFNGIPIRVTDAILNTEAIIS